MLFFSVHQVYRGGPVYQPDKVHRSYILSVCSFSVYIKCTEEGLSTSLIKYTDLTYYLYALFSVHQVYRGGPVYQPDKVHRSYILSVCSFSVYIKCTEEGLSTSLMKYTDLLVTLGSAADVSILTGEEPPSGCAISTVSAFCEVHMMLKVNIISIVTPRMIS